MCDQNSSPNINEIYALFIIITRNISTSVNYTSRFTTWPM